MIETSVDARTASYLAEAGRVLERFDPQTSLQAILELAVPALADVGFIHLGSATHPVLVAATHRDAAANAELASRLTRPEPAGADTPIGRVLAGGPPELVIIDDDVLERVAIDAAHLATLHTRGYRCAVIAPLAGRDGVLGTVSFLLIGSDRTYDRGALAMFGELARRTGIALENHRLFLAEQQARRRAEEARDRIRRLQDLSSRLLGALEEADVAQIMVLAGASALGAGGGFAWLVRRDAVLELVAAEHTGTRVPVAEHTEIPLTAHMPVCDAVKTGVPMMFENLAAMTAAYPGVASSETTEYRAWALIPFVVAGTPVGAVSFSFSQERTFSEDDRELLAAMTGQASLALERCKLLAAERRARAHAEAARMREVQLHGLATRLSTALTTAQVAVIVSEGAIAAVDAYAALAALRSGDMLETVGAVGTRDPALLAKVSMIPVSAALPIADAVRSGELVWCADQRQILARYPQSPELARSIQACGAVPFMFEGRRIGALAVACDEPRQLTTERREMLRAIGQLAAHAFERARLFDALQVSVDHAEAAVQRAEQEQERARIADRRKDEFLAMLGHELRNPLAPISTALDLMDLKGTGGLLAKEREVIRRQVDHMSRLIDDLLDVSRITRGKIQLVKQVIEIGGVIAKAIEMASPLLEQRMQRLSIEVPREGLLVDADSTRLAQVFQNLLTNAAKYSDPHAEITIRARRVDGEVVVEIRDTGIGILPELLPRLFELFVQGERAIDRAEGGLGLGLAIVKSLCDLHGGTIEAASPGAGGGSTFTVRLPHVSAEKLAAAQRTTEKMPKLSRGARVLVVEDNADAAEMLEEFLRELGHEPAVAHDGVAALELLATFRPEIAVLDIGLPVMDGYELARKLREQLGSEKLRLIAMSGYGHDADRARADEAGFEHHLVKPIALDALTALLERLR